jgi:hypothetical protein
MARSVASRKSSAKSKSNTRAKANQSGVAAAAQKVSRQSAKTSAHQLTKTWLSEGIESNRLRQIPHAPKLRETRGKILPLDETQGAKTKHFEIFADDSFGAAGRALCEAMALTVETDYQIYSSWFGGVEIDAFDLHANPGDDGASHFDCGARNINFDWRPNRDVNTARMLADAEVVEVFEDSYDSEWDCGDSTGEGLSRVLAEGIYPNNVLTLNGKTPAATWLDSKRQNWVKDSDGSDQNYESIGCAVLFLNWLRYQLGFHWDHIIGATHNFDDLTLEHIYERLHDMTWESPGNGKGWKAFKKFINAKFPPGHKANLNTNNPFPFPGREQWSTWRNLGHPESLLSPNTTPAVAAREVNRLDVCTIGNDGAVWMRSWNGSAWKPWASLGGDVFAPAAISRSKPGFDTYATGRDNTMWHLPHGYPFEPLLWHSVGGSTSNEGIAAASWAPYRVDCFAIGAGTRLLHRFSDSEGIEFSDWRSLGTPHGLTIDTHPTAVSRGPNLLDCFVTASDQYLWNISWNGTSWSEWQRIGIRKVIGSPAVCSWSPQRLDLMVLDKNSNLLHLRSADAGATWKAGKNLGHPPGKKIFSSPGAVSWGPNRIDCCVTCDDYSLWHIRWG